MSDLSHIIEPLREHAVDVDSLNIDPANANTHPERNMRAIMESLREFGQRQVLVARKDTCTVEAGNGRLEAARKLGWGQVACVFVDDDDITALRYAIADNRSSELSEWDGDVLAQILQTVEGDFGSLDATGFDDGDLDELLSNLDGVDLGDPPEPEVDRAEELREKWGVELGQLWRLGAHELRCGDSREVAVEFDALFFDPPWDAGFDAPECGSVLAFTDGARVGDVVKMLGAPTWLFTWDCVSSWYTPNRPLKRGKHCLWYGDVDRYDFDGAHYGDAGEARDVQNPRGSYRFEPDPRGKHLSDVFSCAITKLHNESEHSHSKPVDWARMLIGNCTEGVVYDPFIGSGTSMVACEQLGRRCIGVEIDPAMCAVAIERLSSMGVTPELVDG